MASLNAIAVAHKVLETVSKGERVNMKRIMLEQGYSKNIAKQPQRVTKQKAYQEVISQAVGKMDQVRDKALVALLKKNMNDEKAVPLATVVDIMTKNTQLLSGRSTDNVALKIEISEALADKYKDVSSDNKDNVEKGQNVA